MAERTFQLHGAAPALNAREREEVEAEVRRMRALVAGLPAPGAVQVRRNPSGALGEYVGLLLDAAARGLPPEVVLPAAVRRRYRRRRWFAFSLEALDKVAAQLASPPALVVVAAVGAHPQSHSLGGTIRGWLRSAARR